MTLDEIWAKADEAFPGCMVERVTRMSIYGPETEIVIYTDIFQNEDGNWEKLQ